MALTITATITVSDDQAYTPLEARIIAAMQAHPANGTAAVVPAAAAPAADPKPTTKRAPKAAPSPAAEESTTSAVLDTTLDEPVTANEPAVEEDLLGGGDDAKEYTLEDAVTAATNLVSAGKAAAVKAALDKVGAKRVGELKGNAAGLTTFMTTLEG